jgi:uncharacterized protein (DUF488 family)
LSLEAWSRQTKNNYEGLKKLKEFLIYTLGTSNHTKEEFLELLKYYHIETVVDVRSFPQSRFEHFKKDNLARILQGEGFKYVYLGKELGGFRKGGYLSYTKTVPYQEGISHLEQIGKESITAFICAERLAWKCHRRFIASSLEEKGWLVEHIIEKGRVWRPKPNKANRLDQKLLHSS